MTGLAGRTPPHDLDAEAAVVATVLLDPAKLARAAEVAPAAAFYARPHQLVIEAATALLGAGMAIDVVTVAGWLKARGRMGDVGGAEQLSKMLDAAPFVANVESYAAIVRDHWRVRQTIAECQRVAAAGYADVGNVDAWIADAGEALARIGATGDTRRRTLATIGDTIRGDLESMAAGTVSERIVQSGIPALDEVLTMAAGDVVVIAGRPAMGKSALAQGIATHVAMTSAWDDCIGAALILSAEMPRVQLGRRALAARARVDVRRLRRLDVKADEWPRLIQAGQDLSSIPLWLDDRGAPTLSYVRTAIAEVKRNLAKMPPDDQGRQVKLAMVVIDYLQIMGIPHDKSRTKTDEIGEVTGAIKGLAKEHELTVLLLSQLSRGVEARPNKRPVLSDLRDSGAIEQDADSVVFAYRDEVYDPKSRMQGVAEIIVAKQRNGSPSRALARFEGAYTMFSEIEPSERAQLEREADEAENGARRSKWEPRQ